MRERSCLAPGLAMILALTLASPWALAATPRSKKAGRPAAGAKSKKIQPEATPAPKVEDAVSPAPAAEETTPPLAPEAKKAAPPAPPAVSLPAPTENRSAARSADEATTANNAEAEAELGRREARRIAAGRIVVAVWAGGGVANRRFSYRDAIGYNLAPYRLPAAPMAVFGIEAYPAASSGIPVLSDLGIRAHVSRGFAFDSSTPQGTKLETDWTRFGGELRQRLLLPGRHAAELAVLVGADASYFGMTASAPVPALLPAARTVSLRFGLDARLRVAWRLSVLGGGAYLLTTSRGEIYEHFRRPRVGGVDADLGFAIDLGSGLDARLAGRYTRYFASFKPRLGDAYVAGGALDEQLQAGLGVRYAH